MKLQTIIVGTIRRNRPDIPKETIETKGEEGKSFMFGFSGDLTIVLYVPRKGKIVTMLSTMHRDSAAEGEDRKPQVILHYNSTKGGVDNMDKTATSYSCRRKNNRWPMALFFNVLDIGALAAYVIWLLSHPPLGGKKRRLRRSFLVNLGKHLASDQIQVRLPSPASATKGRETISDQTWLSSTNADCRLRH